MFQTCCTSPSPMRVLCVSLHERDVRHLGTNPACTQLIRVSPCSQPCTSAAHARQDANTDCFEIQTLQKGETYVCSRSLCDVQMPTFGKKLVVKNSQVVESDVLQLCSGSFLCKMFVCDMFLISNTSTKQFQNVPQLLRQFRKSISKRAAPLRVFKHSKLVRTPSKSNHVALFPDV